MSASNIWREGLAALAELIQGAIGWLLVAPLCALVPKRKGWIAVIGREDGKFIDNTKYFFIDAATDRSRSLRVVHVSERTDVVSAITQAGFEALYYPSLKAVWFLVRCKLVVVDSIEWHQRWRCFLLARARLIQLWHGIGFKRIELDKWRNEARGRSFVASRWLLLPRLARRYISGRIPKYDVVVTTSRFYKENVFALAFRSKHFLTCGYPRNGFSTGRAPLSWLNVDPSMRRSIHTWILANRKLVLVAPTFRDSRATPMGLDPAQLTRLDEFCAENGFEIIFKFHPYERCASKIEGRHLHVLDAHSDIYPLLNRFDVLVTDYSSIYMDFLLMDRPVMFFVPDLAQYTSLDRDIQFDFNSMTPGPKFGDWEELLDALISEEPDLWKNMRLRVRDLAFDNKDQNEATKHLLRFAAKRGWIDDGQQSRQEGRALR